MPDEINWIELPERADKPLTIDLIPDTVVVDYDLKSSLVSVPYLHIRPVVKQQHWTRGSVTGPPVPNQILLCILESRFALMATPKMLTCRRKVPQKGLWSRSLY